jgi:DNA-binding MarR family transcriptional regulator
MTKLETKFTRAEDSLGFVLWKAANVLQRLHADALRDLDVTPAQFSLLTCLVYLRQKGNVTASQIVIHTGMDKMSVSDLIGTLVRERLVIKSKNPADGRSQLISPTAAAVKTTNAAIARIEMLDKQFFAQTGDPDALHTVLLALIDGLPTSVTDVA